jgi:hypothetical protein
MTHTKTITEHVAAVRAQVAKARQRLKEICPSRELAARVALYYDIVREKERHLERLEEAVDAGNISYLKADIEGLVF